MKEESNNGKTTIEALKKRALGYDATEIVEEYSGDDGEIKLIKKKITTKNVPPDVSALKILLDEKQEDYKSMSDEELEQEKIRLLTLFYENQKKEKNKCKKVQKQEQTKSKKEKNGSL